jgi:cytochrome P450
MRRQSTFGNDVNEFRPERFLECHKDKKTEMEHAISTAFGGGRWMCAGRNVAEMELNKLIFEVRADSAPSFISQCAVVLNPSAMYS